MSRLASTSEDISKARIFDMSYEDIYKVPNEILVNERKRHFPLLNPPGGEKNSSMSFHSLFPAIAPIQNIVSTFSGPQEDQYCDHIETIPHQFSSNDGINQSRIILNPFLFGFLPKERAENRAITLEEVIKKHFLVRSTKRVRFEHKLWNALCITKKYPNLFSIFGVMWISKTVIKVNKTMFANVLGITRPTAALFNVQGSFPSHGFEEVEPSELRSQGIDIGDADGINVRLIRHTSGQFTSESGIDALSICRWKINFA